MLCLLLAAASNLLFASGTIAYPNQPLMHDEKKRFANTWSSEETQTTEPPSTAVLTITVAPDNTCGYLSEDPEIAVTCQSGRKCSWEAEYYSKVYCAPDSLWKTICRNGDFNFGDSKSSHTTVRLEKEGEFNPKSVLYCTGEGAYDCLTYEYPGGLTGLGCYSTESQISMIFATAESTTVITQGVDVQDLTVSKDTTDSQTETSSSTHTEISTYTESSTHSSTTTLPLSTSNEVGGGDKSNVGAIAGGVVGGVGALGFIGLCVIGFLLLRRRAAARKKDEDPPSPYEAPIIETQEVDSSTRPQANPHGLGGDWVSPYPELDCASTLPSPKSPHPPPYLADSHELPATIQSPPRAELSGDPYSGILKG